MAKDIKFTHALYDIHELTIVDKAIEDPATYDHVELILKDYFEGSDMMFAWNEDDGREYGLLFLGQFNSGKHGDVQEIIN